MAFLGIVQAGAALVSSVTGATNPKDAERFSIADTLAAQASAGNYAAKAQLRCYAGIGTAQDDQILTQQRFPGYTPGTCVGGGFATEAAKAYAKGKLAEVDARTTGSQILTTVGISAVQAGAQLSPVGPAGAAEQFVAGIPTPVKVGLVLVGAFLLYRVIR